MHYFIESFLFHFLNLILGLSCVFALLIKILTWKDNGIALMELTLY
jgi:hypothetical protein